MINLSCGNCSAPLVSTNDPEIFKCSHCNGLFEVPRVKAPITNVNNNITIVNKGSNGPSRYTKAEMDQKNFEAGWGCLKVVGFALGSFLVPLAIFGLIIWLIFAFCETFKCY